MFFLSGGVVSHSRAWAAHAREDQEEEEAEEDEQEDDGKDARPLRDDEEILALVAELERDRADCIAADLRTEVSRASLLSRRMP